MLRRILLTLGYTLVVIFVVTVTFALVAYGNDYTYDFSTRQIVQRGHVIINSVPGGAKVIVDGKALNKQTPYQAAWSVGQHIFKLERGGYVTWQKALNVVAGQVNLVEYAVLVPKNPPKTLMDSKSDLLMQAISSDHKHIAYIAGGTAPALYTLDLGSGKVVKLYTPKVQTADVPGETLQSVTWSDDASHLLIRSLVGSIVTYRLAAAAGGEPVNLTDQYRFDFSTLAFSPNNWRQLYWISPDGLRRLDVDSQTVSAVLADKVTQFWVVTDRVLYVQQADLGRSLWSLDTRGKRQQLIQALPQSTSYSVAYSSYRGQDELAVVPADTQVGTLYSAILSDTPTAKVAAHGVTAVDFSPDGHLAAFSSPHSIVMYDLDRATLFGTDAIYTISDQPGTLQKLSWFDNYHMLTVRDGRLCWSEYDGANRIDLGFVAAGVAANRSADFRSIVEFVPDGVNGFKIESLGIR
jgi:hypothetical protein